MDLSIIKEIRKIKNLSQQDLGEKLGVSGAYIQQIENNKKNPSIKTLNNIADALEVEMDILFNGISTEIYTRDDVFEVYSKLNTHIPLYEFLGFGDKYDTEFMIFKEGASGNKNFYMKLSDYLKLDQSEIYNWVLSDVIYTLIDVYTLINAENLQAYNFNKNDIKYLIDNKVLESQSIDSLLYEGLSDTNVNKLKKYLNNRTSIKLNELKNKCVINEFKTNFTNNDADLINSKYLNDEYKDKITALSNLFDNAGIKFIINHNNSDEFITLSIPKDNFSKDIHWDNFIAFIDKVYWSIEREVDYLKHYK